MDDIVRTIKNRKGEVVEIDKDIELAKLIIESVKDIEVLSMLFGVYISKEPGYTDSPEFRADLTESLSGYGAVTAIKAIIATAFITVFSRWKQVFDRPSESWERSVDYEAFRTSRYTRLFKNALTSDQITLDLQIFSLTEAWVGTRVDKEGDDAHVFDGIYNSGKLGSKTGVILQRALEIAKNATFKGGHGTDGKYNKYNCNLICYLLLRAFPVIEDMKLSCTKSDDYSSNEDFVIEYQNEDEDVVLYPNKLFEDHKLIMSESQIMNAKGKPSGYEPSVNSVFMYSGMSGFGGAVQRVYTSFNGECEASVMIKSAEQSVRSVPDTRDAYEMRKFLSFDYKNIREFALVISDTIKNNEGKRNIVLKEWRDRHRHHEQTDNRDDSEIYWDNVIMLMLVEMGPSEFLELLLDDDEVFNEMMRNIGRRCIGPTAVGEEWKEYRAEYEQLEKRTALKNTRQFNTCVVELRVLRVLKAIRFKGTKSDDINPFEESLSAKYECMLSCLKTLRQYVDKPEKVDIQKCKKCKDVLLDIFKNIFIFLQIFYTGLDAYANEKKLYIGNDDRERRRKCGEAFNAAGKKLFETIKGQSVSEAYSAFCKMCGEYNTSNSNGFAISAKAKNLKAMITRNYVCNVEKLRYFASIEISPEEKSDIFTMLENFSDKYYSHRSFGDWLDYFKDVFLFLVYHEDYDKRSLHNHMDCLYDKNCDPVYPYMVTYYRENIDRDELKKCSYRVPIPAGDSDDAMHDKGYVVTLLTEEDYPPNTYFCIPLKYGSTDNWWINPLLVPRGFMRGIRQNIVNEG